MDLTPAQRLNDRYRILKLLGTGSMGAVYHAHDSVLNREVAIKQLQLDPIAGEVAPEQIRQQFLREAQSLAALHHPNLPRVTDFFTHDHGPYLVMDYIEGHSLQERLARQPTGFDEAQVLDWADQLLSALEYIHAQQLIHRDIKPGNIRLTPEGRIFLVDFGLVKAYDAAQPQTISLLHGVGTPEYAPPEQYEASDQYTDQRSDLFALGATLYHLLTGHTPITVTRRMADPASFRSPRMHDPHISPAVERVIVRAMELDRSQRFASAADMRAALKLTTQPAAADSTGTIHLAAVEKRATSGVRRLTGARRWRLLAAIIGVAVVAGALGLIAQSGRAPAKATAIPPLRADLKITRLSGAEIPEAVVIQNTGTLTQNLSGWYLESTIGSQTFNFPAGYMLAPGTMVRIESYTGAKNDPPGTLLWSVDPIWRNAGDKALLRNTAGAAISAQCYGDACP